MYVMFVMYVMYVMYVLYVLYVLYVKYCLNYLTTVYLTTSAMLSIVLTT